MERAGEWPGQSTGRNGDPAFNTRGWNSSYTGLALSQAQMRAYVDGTGARIRSLEPGRVLELGCGTGLMMFPLLPHLRSYTGLDVAASNIRNLTELQRDPAMQAAHPGLRDARLHCAAAQDLARLPGEQTDTIVMASVIQYFPSEAYLLHTLDRLIAHALSERGSLFIGDVRSLPLLTVFHASVLRFKSGGRLAPDVLAARAQKAAETKASWPSIPPSSML